MKLVFNINGKEQWLEAEAVRFEHTPAGVDIMLTLKPKAILGIADIAAKALTCTYDGLNHDAESVVPLATRV